MATVNRPATIPVPPDLDASAWSNQLDDATDPENEIRDAIVARNLGTDDAHDRLVLFRTVIGMMSQVVSPDEDEQSWRETFLAIDVERPDRPLFREYQ